jgi:hypothetical protein
MKKSKMLILAKAHLALSSEEFVNGKELFICHALSEVKSRLKSSDVDETYFKLKEIIRAKLDGEYTFNDWLAKNFGIVEPSFRESDEVRDAYDDKMQITRLAWMNSMIEEFAAQGD